MRAGGRALDVLAAGLTFYEVLSWSDVRVVGSLGRGSFAHVHRARLQGRQLTFGREGVCICVLLHLIVCVQISLSRFIVCALRRARPCMSARRWRCLVCRSLLGIVDLSCVSCM